jgi:hypothetical protein
MSRRLTDEEIAERYSQQYRVATPEAGLSNLGGSAIDRLQAKAFGMAEPFGLSRDYRLAQEAEANRTAQRYYDTNQEAIGSFRNISGVGDVGRYAAELGVQTLPELVPIVGAGLIGGPAAAYGVAGLSGIGEVMQAQRQQAGRTDLTAVPLGLAYGGVEAATGIVGRLAGTGVRAERTASAANRYLDNLGGFTGGAARTGAAFGRTGLSEAIGEVGQEYIANVGRLAVDPRVELFSPEAMDDYAESFVGGGLLGGLVGGAAGGWRRSQGFRDAARERDLTSTEQDQTPLVQRPLESQFVTQDQTVGLQSFINQNVGVTRPKRKDYVSQFKAAYDEPTGQFVNDPETGIERPLTVGEALQRSQTALDLTQEKPADAAATAQVVASTVRDPRSYELRDTFGVIPTPSSLQLYSDIQATGIPADSDLLMDVWKFAGEKPMTPKRLEKAQQLLDAAIIKSRQEAPIGAGVSTVQQPAGGLGVGSPVVQGTMGNAGRPAPVTGAMGGGAPAAGAPLQQAGILPSTAGQPSTTVTTTAPAAALGQPSTTGAPSGTQASQTIQTAPQGQTAAPIQPAAPIAPNTTLRLNRQEQLQDNVLGELKQELDALEGQTQPSKGDLSRMQELRDQIEYAETNTQLATQRDFTADDLEAVVEQYLSKSKDKERDRQILNAYLTARRAVPSGYKGNIAKEIADSFGVAESRVRQIGNPEKLANIAESMGFARDQVFDTLGIQSAKKAAAAELGKLEGELSRLEGKDKPSQADVARMSELSEQIERVKGNIESGDLAATLKNVGIEGEAGESFATMDDAREWQKASTAGSQLAVDLVAAADAIDALKAAAAELESLNLPQAAAAAAENIDKLTAKYEALVAGATKPKGERKKAKAKTEAAQVAAEEKDAAKEAEAAKFRAERAAKLEADRKGLAVGDTVMNPKLGTGVVKSFAGDGDATTVTVAFQSGQTKELSVKLAKLEKTNAVQVESPAGVPVQPKAEAGKEVGRQVRRAPKPAEKSQAPTVILTQAEQAAQAWDVVAADFPDAPKFADLTKAQQNTFIGFGEGNWERGDVELELTKLARAAAPAQRVEYPSTAGQQNAPAYLIPSQRAVVDFMNGDITREDLQQKFADLGMTEGQQRSVTNRIEWFPADFAAVKSLVDSGPKLRALRTVFTLDEDNATVELQEQELSRLEAVPGIGAATDRLRKEGLGGLVDYVGGWYTTDSKVNWDGGFTAIDGQAAVLLRRGPMTDSQRVEWTVYHEVGHAADQTHLYGGGVFSSLPVFNVRLEKGQIKPVGAVMKAAFDHYNSNPTSDLSKHLSYPFDRTQHGDLDGDGIREELFAQLWATYTTRDGREFLEDNLPEVADFMEQVYEQVKQTDYAAAKANEAQRSTQAGGQAAQGDGQPRQVPLRQTAVRFRASRPQGLIDRNIAKLPKMSQQPVKRVTEALGDLGGKYLDYAVFTSDLVKRAVAAGLPAAQTFSDRLASRNAKVSEEERKIEKIADRYASIEEDAKGSGPGSVNEFLFESTRTGKWGYDTAKFKADPAMKAMFDKLKPKAQQFVKDVFAHGDATLSNKKKIVLEATNSEYDAMIKAAQAAGDTKTEATLKAEKAATLKRFQTLFRIREGVPYAPIKRTGSYVVVGESAEYQKAKANNDTATLKKLESDPDHYHVSFTDTKWQARSLRDRLAEQGVFTDPQVVSRSESFDEAFSGEAMLPALTKMRAAVDRRAQDSTGKKDPTAGKLLNIINQLYLEALAEGSARKSEMRRRGVAGEVDMLQSFTQQGRADANFLASVEFEPKIQDALQQMRNESRKGDRERKSEIFDELTKRYAGTLDPQPSPFISGLTNMASKFFLASSPAYYLQNLTQPFMMSLPAMAGRHDYTKAAAELTKAYAELGPLFKDVKLIDEQFDFSKVPADVRTAINELVNQGKIDIGLATEINEYKVEADNKLSKFAQRLNKGMRLAVQKVEATNRLSTAIAAYRLEFERAKKDPKIADPKAAATQYAADILTDTHGDYTAFNAPRAFNTQWGKVALQFRKFQLIQIAFFYKLFRDAFTKPDERAAAIKTLTYALSHTAVFAGMMGIPGYAAISAILSAFGDEDEPFDLTAWSREQLGPEWADMIMRGAPTVVGMDLSGKIGAGNMLSIMPFSNADLSTTAGRAEAFGTLMGGAALGMASRMADGLVLMSNGDYYKGLERVMPKGVSDALKAARQGAEGMTRRNGDVVLPDSEISSLDTVFTALGVPAVEQTVTYERQNRMRDLTKNFQDRTTRIKNDYAKAVREKDTAAMAEARTAWTKLQQARQRNGLTPQPVSNLLKAPQEQKAREQRTVGGVAYREGQRKLAESIAEN